MFHLVGKKERKGAKMLRTEGRTEHEIAPMLALLDLAIQQEQPGRARRGGVKILLLKLAKREAKHASSRCACVEDTITR